MYVWFVSADIDGNPVDEGIWQSTNSGTSWTQINDSAITNCGDLNGCGVEQGFYDLELLAVPNGATATDLYAGTINFYKCSITAINPTCSTAAFINLTHVYGCDPLGALAHVHPDQHAAAYAIPTAGSDAGAALLYLANDGGIYRALNGFTGLTTGSCSGANQFDDLNQNLGSMTQFVSFSQSTTDPNTILGGTQDNGSPATASATTSASWSNVLSGDGGYNAIDPATGTFFASNPDTGFGGLNIQDCPSGVDCDDSLFNVVVNSSDLQGDDGAFYFPYLLDPQSNTSMLVGTCRVWSGPRSGGLFTLLSLNFDTLGTGTCAGTEVNVVRALAAGGPTNALGSLVIYATTDGPGPSNLSSPVGGNVWVTTNASAVSGVSSTFSNVTVNGPDAASINPNQFPISDVAIDASDTTGNTAYVTVMGFTGGAGHVWQTTNAGASWTDFTGTGPNALPDSPANAVVVDPVAHVVYVGTDVGVFASLTSAPAWSELGPDPSMAGSSGFLPDVAVTALSLFNSGGQKLLRASTYGRGVWQFNLLATPSFDIVVSNTPLTLFLGNTGSYNGTVTSINGYDNPVELSCAAGNSAPPVPCTPSPVSVTPDASGVPFSVNVGSSSVGDYDFNLLGSGSDPNNTTQDAALTLHVVNWSISEPSPNPVTLPRGGTSPPVSFQIAAQGSLNQSVTLSCSFTPNIAGAACNFTPGATFNLTSASPVNATATVSVPGATPLGSYAVTLEASTPGSLLNASFIVNVAPNPTFVLTLDGVFPNVKAGSAGTAGAISITAQDGFAGTVGLSCVTALSNSCSVNPSSVDSFPATATLVIDAGSLAGGSYQVSVQGISGAITNSLPVPFVVDDYLIAGPSVLVTVPGTPVTADLTLSSEDSYVGFVVATCDVSTLAGALCTLTPPNPIAVGNGATVALTANLAVPNNAVPSSYNISVSTHDVGGEPSHTWSAALAVQDFSFSAGIPPAQSIGAGNNAVYNVSVTPLGGSFNNAVALACSVSAPNSTCSLSSGTVTPNGSPAVVTATIATNSGGSTPQGNYMVVITGTSAAISHSVTLPLTVANSFQLAITNAFPGKLVPSALKAVPATLTLTPNYVGSLSVTCVAATDSNATCTLPSSSIRITGSPVTITILLTVFPSAAPGTYSATVNVADPSGSPSHSITIPFTVVQDYTIENLSAASQTITAGQSISYNLSVAPVGSSYSDSVTLSCRGTPLFTGSCTFSPNPTPPLSNSTAAAVVMTITTPSASGQLWMPRTKPGPGPLTLWLAAAAVWLGAIIGRRRCGHAFPLGLALAVLCLFPSCGGGGANGGNTPAGNVQGAPTTYTITVAGSPPSISQAGGSTVTLIVNQ